MVLFSHSSQYYLAYRGWYELFIVFIPVFMFVWIPFILVLQGETKMIMSSMAGLPTSLMLCVFGVESYGLFNKFTRNKWF